MDGYPPACYRHPDRPTRLSCSSCGRPICAGCSHDAAVGQKCPACVTPEGRTRVVTPGAITHTDRHTTPLTIVLIALNCAVWAIGTLAPDIGNRLFVEGAQWRPAIAAGEWWRGLSAMFLHATSPFHIMFNMWALWVFGPTLERRWGTLPFGALYLAGGLGGSALFFALGSTNPAVGASGAIFGLLGAVLVASYRQRHTGPGRAVFTQLTILLAINLMLPLISPRIAWEAHLGGLATGIAVAFAWERLAAGGRHHVMRRALIGLGPAAVALTVLIIG